MKCPHCGSTNVVTSNKSGEGCALVLLVFVACMILNKGWTLFFTLSAIYMFCLSMGILGVQYNCMDCSKTWS